MGAIGGGGRGLLIAGLGEVLNGLDGAESWREDHGRRWRVITGRRRRRGHGRRSDGWARAVSRKKKKKKKVGERAVDGLLLGCARARRKVGRAWASWAGSTEVAPFLFF